MTRKIDLEHATTADEVAEIVRGAYRSGDDVLLVRALFKGFPLGSIRSAIGEKLWKQLPERTVPFLRREAIRDTLERHPNLENLDLWGLEKPRRIFVEDAVLQIAACFDEIKAITPPEDFLRLEVYKGDYEERGVEIWADPRRSGAAQQRLGFYFEKYAVEDGWVFVDVSTEPTTAASGPFKEDSIREGFKLMFNTQSEQP